MAAMFLSESGRNENFYRGHSIDDSYIISVHLAKWFQRRRFLEIDQPKTRMPVAAMFVNTFDFGMVPPVWYFLFYILFLEISLSQMSSECVT